jgi:hypothetical protein
MRVSPIIPTRPTRQPRRFLGNTPADWTLIATSAAAFVIGMMCLWSKSP